MSEYCILNGFVIIYSILYFPQAAHLSPKAPGRLVLSDVGATMMSSVSSGRVGGTKLSKTRIQFSAGHGPGQAVVQALSWPSILFTFNTLNYGQL